MERKIPKYRAGFPIKKPVTQRHQGDTKEVSRVEGEFPWKKLELEPVSGVIVAPCPNCLLDRHHTVFPVSQSLRVEYGTKRIAKPELKVRRSNNQKANSKSRPRYKWLPSDRPCCDSERSKWEPPKSHAPKGNAKATVRRLAGPFKLAQEKKESHGNLRETESRADVEFQHLGRASNRSSLIAGSFSDCRAIFGLRLPVLVISKIS